MKSTDSKETVSHKSQNSQITVNDDQKDYHTGEGVIEDQIEEILDEWKSAKDFELSAFAIRFLFATFAAFSLASDTLLVSEYLKKGLTLANETLANENHTIYPNQSTSVERTTHETPSDQNNLVFGFLTLFIQFLPGIQWYTSVATKHLLLRFLTTIFFPFFTVIFKVRYVMLCHSFFFCLGWGRISPRPQNCPDGTKAVHF